MCSLHSFHCRMLSGKNTQAIKSYLISMSLHGTLTVCNPAMIAVVTLSLLQLPRTETVALTVPPSAANSLVIQKT